jgi:hypothetical protein
MKHRLLVVAGALVVGGLFGAQPAAAAPLAPELPTDIVLATDLPEPPKPQVDTPATDIVAEEPCWELDVCPSEPDPCEDEPAQCDPPAEEPPVEEPLTDEPPVEEPAADDPGDEPSADPTIEPVDRPAPAGVRTPNRIDTGAGPVDLASIDWWLVAVPLLVLVGLLGLGAHRYIRRSESVRP